MEEFSFALIWLGFFASIFFGWYFYLQARNKERMALIEKGDISKTPKLLVECYRYLAFFYYQQADKMKSTEPELAVVNMTNSIDYWEKVLALEPEDVQAKTALENLKTN